MHKIIYTLSLVLALFATYHCANSKQIHPPITVFMYTNPAFVGDHNNVVGIIDSFKKEYSGSVTVQAFTPHERTALEATLAQKRATDKAVLFAIGDDGLALLSALPPHTNLTTCFMVCPCHLTSKTISEYKALAGRANFIALSQHNLTPELQALAQPPTKLITIVGVAHNLTDEVLDKAYAERHHHIALQPPYTALMLAGDAPTPDGTQRYFTASEAAAVAQRVAHYARQHAARIIILNSPRTGKFNHATGALDSAAHRNGISDAVTAAARNALLEAGLVNDVDFTVFDFQYGGTSMYQPILATIKKNGGTFFMPGESTSMVSEAVSHLPANRIIVYLNGAMNDLHQAHVESEYDAGHMQVLTREGQYLTPQATATAPAASAAQTIAKAVIASLG